MPFTVTEFESTPNPNAVKCWLDKPISDGPRSFLNAQMAGDDPIARALFEQAGATTVLFNGDWMTVNKPADADWSKVKATVKRVLKDAQSSAVRPSALRASLSTQRRMIESLCRWFPRHQRDLPWRKRRTGYTALVSEAMLQQTQVSRVIDSYRDFMRRFPTLKPLAAADEQEVLSMWRGLGYYRRARNLHAAARMIVEQHGGRVPRSAESLRNLPGVGRYTAGAIASIVFDQPEPIVDGNVQRVLARVFGRRGLKSDRELNQWAWGVAEQLVRHAPKPGIFNEAMMELGATVCLPAPAKPHCERCPLARMCSGKRSGLRLDAATSKRRAKLQAVHHHAVIVRHASTGRILVEQRPPEGMWSNMWQVPTIEAPNQLDVSTVRRSLPVAVQQLRPIGRFQHTTTHRLISFHVHQATGHSGARSQHWREASDVDELPMSNPQRRIVAMAQGSQAD